MRASSRLIFATLLALATALVLAIGSHGQSAPDEGRPSGDYRFSNSFRGSPIVVTTTARLAGAIDSITWRGREFIDSVDHGRQLQSAASFDNAPEAVPETFNPTEAGSRRDGVGPRSTSQLLALAGRGAALETRTRMAFWLAPGERSAGQLARNREPLSRHILAKKVVIGPDGILQYDVTFEIPEGEPHTTAQFEALTGYMPPEFSVFHRFDRAAGRLEPLSDGPGEQADPVVFSTPDGQFAMGIIAAGPPPARAQGPGYGRFRFAEEKVVKWNCVYRVGGGVGPGPYRFRLLVPMGTRDDVEGAMRTLAASSGAAR